METLLGRTTPEGPETVPENPHKAPRMEAHLGGRTGGNTGWVRERPDRRGGTRMIEREDKWTQ